MRFSESDKLKSGQLDFVPRARRSQILTLVGAFTFVMALIFIFVLTFPPSNRQISALLSVATVGALCLFVVYRKQQSLDLVMSTEYQNLLFSQAASVGADFCLFVRRDGTVVYANDGLRKMFPQFGYASSQALEGIFDAGNVQKPDRERMMNAIFSAHQDRLIFPIRSGGAEKTYILNIEPLKRPAGFSVIRGREYTDKRTGSEVMPDILRSTSLDKLNHLLAHTPVALYTTDAYGRIEYATPAFEALLGYQTDALAEQRIELRHLLRTLGDQVIEEDYSLNAYEGNASLKRLDGTTIQCLLFQQLIFDEHNKPAGVTGSILPNLKG